MAKFLTSWVPQKLKNRLFKSFAGVMGLKIAASGLGFILNIFLARFLGVADFGVYTYALAWRDLLIIPALLGLDTLIVREVAVYRTKSAWGLLGGILRWSNFVVLGSSISIALIAIAIVANLNLEVQSQMFLPFCLAMSLLPTSALRNVRLAAMQGLKLVFMGLLPEMIFVPVLVMGISGAWYLLSDRHLTASMVLGSRIIATLITLLIGIYLLQKNLPQEVKQAQREYDIKVWRSKLLPFMLLGGMYVITSRSDTLMLGTIIGAEASGLYSPVIRGVQLLAFVLTAVNSVLSPNIAGLYAQNKKLEMQQVVTQSSRIMLLVSLPLAAFFIFGGHWYLSLFGAEFTQARSALSILCLGQLFSIASGSVGVLLTMTGNEKFNLIASTLNVLSNIVLNWFWIPLWGLSGAAAATAVSTVLVNIFKVISVRQQIGIDSTALGKFSSL
ncbi:flippase [Waterburya agarophytonicola K14]|uniref:Flippase n=1 Tax=Waterburya agarophytonicola KI4 TaxID=2874699 RepID=A0A964FGF4_9CYAN|nr:flippase [Waterburya agarophytonicola]MCC0176458.1 flippase [Waterburya agarophytonicola KI4]